MGLPSSIYLKSQSKATIGSKVSVISFCLTQIVSLIADPENVIIVHCNSGKGRTGTAICALLLFLGYFSNVDDCLKFFGHQRFTCGKGVSQPCQLRYLYYFEAFFRNKIKSPAAKRLKGIQFDKVPTFSSGGCVPFFEIYSCRGLDIRKTLTFPA